MRPAEAARCSGADDGPVVIAGGAGFIGTNLAARLLAEGERVVHHRRPQPAGGRAQSRLAGLPATATASRMPAPTSAMLTRSRR